MSSLPYLHMSMPEMLLTHLQIEAVKLAAESQRKHLEATLANAKRDAAQASTSQKTAAAVWHGELDFQKAEVRGGHSYCSSWAVRWPATASGKPLGSALACHDHWQPIALRTAVNTAVIPSMCAVCIQTSHEVHSGSVACVQVSRIRRELERVEAERTRAQEDARR